MRAPIDLAPHNPYTLSLASAVLLAPGSEVRGVAMTGVGAVATRTATLHTRRGPAPLFCPSPAGLVVTGIPTVGIRTLLKEEARRWQRAQQPTLVSLQGSAHEVAEMVGLLESVEGVAGLLVRAEEDIRAVMVAARRQTPLPILALLDHSPHLAADVLAVEQAGVDALVVAAPPPAAAGVEELVEGDLLGPSVFPLTLRAVAEARAAVHIPVVALGGIATGAFARTALKAGATAVMVDAARWGDPFAPVRVARELGEAAG
jgi:dihydroorotate dehydrogenase (NAD+) catalytic subunit